MFDLSADAKKFNSTTNKNKHKPGMNQIAYDSKESYNILLPEEENELFYTISMGIKKDQAILPCNNICSIFLYFFIIFPVILVFSVFSGIHHGTT